MLPEDEEEVPQARLPEPLTGGRESPDSGDKLYVPGWTPFCGGIPLAVATQCLRVRMGALRLMGKDSIAPGSSCQQGPPMNPLTCSAGLAWCFQQERNAPTWAVSCCWVGSLGTPDLDSLLLSIRGHKMTCCYLVPPVLQSLTRSPSSFPFQTFPLMASCIICRVYS